MTKFDRIITIVLDSVGIGALPDAAKYNDEGADTLGHIAEAAGDLNMLNMQKLGLGNLHEVGGIHPVVQPSGYYGKMREASIGKDTMTGHWEMMGLYIDKPFITFTETGFPKELIDELELRTGSKIVGNKAASGTEIMEELGEHHVKTGDLIVYTSADSVLQIAANEDTYGLERLYKACEIARELTMKEEWRVGRVIARPFVGTKKGEFKRTSNRHDYALKPFEPTTLNDLKDADYDVIAIGKIVDIFDGEGITSYEKTKSNEDGMNKTIATIEKDFNGLLYVNLVDFDALWGHRRNPQGYKEELELFDRQLGELLPKLRTRDLLILTSDHGNDPTAPGTDHTREYTMQIYYSPQFIGVGTGLLPVSDTFADIAATIAENFKIKTPANGKSLLNLLQ
jgi:phosphopentomutase